MKHLIAVLIPCFNEETTIKKVVKDFRRELPDAAIYVYDNNSTDGTVKKACEAGAQISFEHKQGKGNVVRAMFRDVSADLYVMVDGDGTYPAERVHDLISPLAEGKADMTVNTRLAEYEDRSFPVFHKFGNELIRRTINIFFGTKFNDVLSGHRFFSERFVKSVPILSSGFEVETEQTLLALDKRFTIQEIPLKYPTRPEGSVSKLNTFLDGLLMVKSIYWILKDYCPPKFFSFAGLIALLAGVGVGMIPIGEFIQTGIVIHPSTAVLATEFFLLVSLLSFATGLILDTLNRQYQETFI